MNKITTTCENKSMMSKVALSIDRLPIKKGSVASRLRANYYCSAHSRGFSHLLPFLVEMHAAVSRSDGCMLTKQNSCAALKCVLIGTHQLGDLHNFKQLGTAAYCLYSPSKNNEEPYISLQLVVLVNAPPFLITGCQVLL